MGLALCFSSYSNAQETAAQIESSNVLNPNTIEGNYLPCSGDDCWGGLSGGQVPNWNGDVAFWGYGGGILRWTTAINQALEQAGVQINGYNYSWYVKNYDANRSQNDGDDYFKISVSLYDYQGQAQFYKQYNLEGTYEWMAVEGTEYFKSPYDAANINYIQIRAEGDDNGFWAGHYGPEFDVSRSSLSLLYSYAEISDPCTEIPVTDPTCPGFIGAGTTEEINMGIPEVEVVETYSEPIVEESIAVVEESLTAELEAVEQIAAASVSNEPVAENAAEESTSLNTSRILDIVSNSTVGQDGVPVFDSTIGTFSSTITSQQTASSQSTSVTSAVSATSVMPSLTSSPAQSSQNSTSGSQGDSSGSEAELIALKAAEDSAQDEESGNDNEPEENALGSIQPNIATNSFNSSYVSFVPDGRFYTTKEIYQQLYVPDSRRGLRMGLASQLKWDEMVDQQYQR